MSIHVVTVFGGTGFLGRRIVRHLRKHEFSVRIASRHPDRSRKLFGSDDPCLQSVEVDTRDERMVADVLAGTYAAVNAVSLYVERGMALDNSGLPHQTQRPGADGAGCWFSHSTMKD